jgi:hypothetical protein
MSIGENYEGNIISIRSDISRFSRGTIHRHSTMRSHGVYLCFVVFNDYIDSSAKDMATGLQYVPLGLSDLSRLTQTATMTEL